MAGTTGNRSYTYPTLGDANDVPFYMQTLAEALDTDVHTIDSGTFKRVGFTLAGVFTQTTSSTTKSAVSALATAFNAVAGHRYRFTVNIGSRSSVANADTIGVGVNINGSEVTYFPKMANGSASVNGIGTQIVCVGYWTAPSTAAGVPLAVTINRAVGTGTITVYSAASEPASVLIEDMGVA